jgi:succinate dehydrogenase flavin-adding protein (antitoxin of CptAB toxin-antitoxin module)
MPNKFDRFAEQAEAMTDDEFKNRFSSLTRLSDDDITKVIKDTGIGNEDLAMLLAEVKNATEFNNKTAQSIASISGGVQALVAITKKLLF